MTGLIQSFSFRFSRRFSSSVSAGIGPLTISPNATVAYSLRSLDGAGNPPVVRVRRDGDNHERDFTAGDVASGELVNFVNSQITPPLDIRELDNDGRTGDFLIAKAAYSLRSLGTRQATVTSSGDTDGDTSGKFVCQVRRSSDDKIKSFTADEITDGTLVSFVNSGFISNGVLLILVLKLLLMRQPLVFLPQTQHQRDLQFLQLRQVYLETK